MLASYARIAKLLTIETFIVRLCAHFFLLVTQDVIAVNEHLLDDCNDRR